MFRVNLINYIIKIYSKYINEYCSRIREILYHNVFYNITLSYIWNKAYFILVKNKITYFVLFFSYLCKLQIHRSKWIAGDTYWWFNPTALCFNYIFSHHIWDPCIPIIHQYHYNLVPRWELCDPRKLPKVYMFEPGDDLVVWILAGNFVTVGIAS